MTDESRVCSGYEKSEEACKRRGCKGRRRIMKKEENSIMQRMFDCKEDVEKLEK